MASRYCVHPRELEHAVADGDTALERVTWDASRGSPLLVQRLLSFTAGTSATRRTGRSEEVLFVVDGHGTLVVNGTAEQVGPDTGVFVPRGSAWHVEHGHAQPVDVVAVELPDPEPATAPGQAIVRLAEVDDGATTPDRRFQLLVGPRTGCGSATQFLGTIPPGRAPDHYHHYDQVVYVLEGHGRLHVDDDSVAVEPGSCIHLPNRVVHSLESTGDTGMRVLGVLRPAGSPAETHSPDSTLAPSGDG